MNNNDVYKYINSKDIREYLREIGYKFNAAEAAWLIDQCANLNIKEKHNALNDLMQTMPDPAIEAVPSRVFQRNYQDKTLYPLIEEYIDAENELLYAFYCLNPDAVYIPAAYYEYSIHGVVKYGRVHFPEHQTLERFENNITGSRAYSSLKKLLGEETKDYEELRMIEVCKKYIDLNFEINVKLHADGTPVSVDFRGMRDEFEKKTDILTLFEEMWFNFPVPFKRGDIVCLTEREDGGRTRRDQEPFIVRGTTYGNTAEKRPDYRGCDTTDMNVYGYYIDDNGKIYSEVSSSLMDVEYYRGEFNGVFRTLPLLSEIMKNETDEPAYDLLMNGYLKFRLDDCAANSYPYCYMDEYLEKFKINKSE